jgi:class 3 adenylate cyclase
MKSIISRLHKFYIPASYWPDELLLRRAKIFVNSTLITSLFAFFYVGNTILFQMPHLEMQIGLYACFFFSLPFMLKAGLRLNLLANIFILLFWTSCIYDVIYTGGLISGTIPWFAMVGVVATMLTDLSTGIFWMVLSFLATMAIGILQITGTPFVPEILPSFFNTLMLTSHTGLILIVFVVASVMERAYVGSLGKLDKKNKIIEEEKKRSDELLLNILPAEVMEELKATGKTQAHSFDMVTVLFADVKDFTLISQELSAQDLVGSIDSYFERFDNIIDRFGIEKIKTIGDSYVCAGGIPVSSTDNPERVVGAALEFMRSVAELNKIRAAENKIAFEFRIGIHTGPLVAGVVGIKKFAYDIWGDTVNTAARMEQNGEAGKINITETTYQAIKDKFNCTYRGEIEAKNKGKLQMYFVDSSRV